MYRYVVFLIAMLLLGACSSDKNKDKDKNDNPRGDTAPDFTLPTSDGETVTLSDYEEPVLLFFHMAEG